VTILDLRHQPLAASQQASRQPTLRVWGLGKKWPDIGPVAMPESNHWMGARATHYESSPDGSGCVSMNLDEVYLVPQRAASGTVPGRGYADRGVRAERALAIDYSGRCGAPALIALVDVVRGGGRKTHPLVFSGSEAGPGPRPSTNAYAFRMGDATMQVTFVAPAKVQYARATDGWRAVADGDAAFFVVATVQRGPAPTVKLDGEGLAARVCIGDQTVRYDGRQIILGR
jgi:hypothetical protein